MWENIKIWIRVFYANLLGNTSLFKCYSCGVSTILNKELTLEHQEDLYAKDSFIVNCPRCKVAFMVGCQREDYKGKKENRISFLEADKYELERMLAFCPEDNVTSRYSLKQRLKQVETELDQLKE